MIVVLSDLIPIQRRNHMMLMMMVNGNKWSSSSSLSFAWSPPFPATNSFSKRTHCAVEIHHQLLVDSRFRRRRVTTSCSTRAGAFDPRRQGVRLSPCRRTVAPLRYKLQCPNNSVPDACTTRTARRPQRSTPVECESHVLTSL